MLKLQFALNYNELTAKTDYDLYFFYQMKCDKISEARKIHQIKEIIFFCVPMHGNVTIF